MNDRSGHAVTMSPALASALDPMLSTVKYSLRELLAELQLEKAADAEKLPQNDIAKLFHAQTQRRRGHTST